MGGGYSVTLDLDLGKKVGNLYLGGYSVTSDLDLGKKVGNLYLGGYSVTLESDLGKKLEIWIGGRYSVKVMEKEKNLLYRKNLPDQFGIIIHLNILN